MLSGWLVCKFTCGEVKENEEFLRLQLDYYDRSTLPMKAIASVLFLTGR
jgi:hypothetical protein